MIELDKGLVTLTIVCLIIQWLAFTIILFKYVNLVDASRKLKESIEDQLDFKDCKCCSSTEKINTEDTKEIPEYRR